MHTASPVAAVPAVEASAAAGSHTPEAVAEVHSHMDTVADTDTPAAVVHSHMQAAALVVASVVEEAAAECTAPVEAVVVSTLEEPESSADSKADEFPQDEQLVPVLQLEQQPVHLVQVQPLQGPSHS